MVIVANLCMILTHCYWLSPLRNCFWFITNAKLLKFGNSFLSVLLHWYSEWLRWTSSPHRRVFQGEALLEYYISTCTVYITEWRQITCCWWCWLWSGSGCVLQLFVMKQKRRLWLLQISNVSLSCVLSRVSTTRVDGPSWRVTGFHYPSTRAVLTGARFH